MNAADKLDLIDPEQLRGELDRRHGERGVRALRAILDRDIYVLTHSELERRFLPLATQAGLPPPETQRRLQGHRVDFHWPALGLIVEVDGLRYHRTPAQQGADARRFQAHTAAGLTPLRFTHGQVTFEAGHVVKTLRRTASLLTG